MDTTPQLAIDESVSERSCIDFHRDIPGLEWDGEWGGPPADLHRRSRPVVVGRRSAARVVASCRVPVSTARQDWGMTLALPIGDEANELLRRNPLALLVGMVLDQQMLVP
ncbi:hypothetical protein GCM10027290_25240 [Micromonospora sonneratiae]